VLTSRVPWLHAVLLAAARILVEVAPPGVRCVSVVFAGLQCPLCGGTRSLASLSSLKFEESFHFNELVFAGFLISLSLVVAGIPYGTQLMWFLHGRRPVGAFLALAIFFWLRN
jgi:hypothetical protein